MEPRSGLLCQLRPLAQGDKRIVLQIQRGLGVVSGDHAQLFTCLHLGAAAAGFDSPVQCAPADRAERFAVGRFYPVDPAADTADHLRRDLHAVELRPTCGDLPPQRFVVRDRCQPGLTAFAVQAADRDIVFHFFSPVPPACLFFIIIRNARLPVKRRCTKGKRGDRAHFSGFVQSVNFTFSFRRNY